MTNIMTRRITCADIFDAPFWPSLREAYAREVPVPGGRADPDEERLRAFEKTGCFKGVGVFVDGEFAGFFAYFLGPSLMQRGKVAAQSLNVYVRKEFRGLGVGRKLIEAAAEAAKEDGADWIILEAVPGTRADKRFAHMARHVGEAYCVDLGGVDGRFRDQ